MRSDHLGLVQSVVALTQGIIVGITLVPTDGAIPASNRAGEYVTERYCTPRSELSRIQLNANHGTQFTSWSFSQNIARLGIMGSMGTIGDCYDNAPMEAFWGRMQVELLNRKEWITIVELSIAMADYICNFYNAERRHSSLGYLTPREFELIESSKNPSILT